MSDKHIQGSETIRPWMNGFDSLYDKLFFGTLGKGVLRQIALSELGVLSHDRPDKPDFLRTIPAEAIGCIKRENGYIGNVDPIKFALGASAAYKYARTTAEETYV